MSAVVAFWLGGAIATLAIFAGEAIDQDPDANDVEFNLILGICAIVWPLLVAAFLADVMSKRRP